MSNTSSLISDFGDNSSDEGAIERKSKEQNEGVRKLAKEILNEEEDDDDDEDSDECKSLDDFILSDEMNIKVEEQNVKNNVTDEEVNKQVRETEEQEAEVQKQIDMAEGKDVDLDKLKNEFMEVDFHPNEPRPPDRFMYSAYFDNIRHTLNTYLRRPIKKPFTSNTKKTVLSIYRNEDPVLEMAYPQRSEEEWRAETQEILTGEIFKMFNKVSPQEGLAATKKPSIMKKNGHEFTKHKLHPFFKTRDFRKKIAFIYYPVMVQHVQDSNGRFPVFKLSKNAHLKLKPGTASTSSIQNKAKPAHHKNQSNIPTSTNFNHMHRDNHVQSVYT